MRPPAPLLPAPPLRALLSSRAWLLPVLLQPLLTHCSANTNCSRRAMEFIVALLERLHTDRQVSLSAAASETYYATLQVGAGCWVLAVGAAGGQPQ